jgi:ParB-like nuclease domain
MQTSNPALLPDPALFDVTTVAKAPVEGSIERVELDALELAPNARREISRDGIERLAGMLMRTGQLVPCIGHRPDPGQPRTVIYDGQRRLLAARGVGLGLRSRRSREGRAPPPKRSRPALSVEVRQAAVGVIVTVSFFASLGSGIVTSTTPSCVSALMSLASTPAGSAIERLNDP